MGSLNAATALLYAAIAVFVLWRVIIKQLTGVILSMRNLWLIPGILLVFGCFSTFSALPKASGTEIGLLGADLAVLAALGVLRGGSTSLSIRDGFAFQKGSSVTVILWLVTIGVRVGFAVLGLHLGTAGALTSASIWLTLGLSIGLQNAVVYARARKLGLRIAANRAESAQAGR
jgi:hypothetical protein